MEVVKIIEYGILRKSMTNLKENYGKCRSDYGSRLKDNDINHLLSTYGNFEMPNRSTVIPDKVTVTIDGDYGAYRCCSSFTDRQSPAPPADSALLLSP